MRHCSFLSHFPSFSHKWVLQTVLSTVFSLLPWWVFASVQNDGLSHMVGMYEGGITDQQHFSLLKQRQAQLVFWGEERYYSDTGFDLTKSDGVIHSFSEYSDANHVLSHVVAIDYGVRDNINLSLQLPLITKFQTERDLHVSSLGDLTLGVKWQPFPIQPVVPVTTLYGEWTVPTGKSPYDLDVENDLSSGLGYASWTVGLISYQEMNQVTFIGDVDLAWSRNLNGLKQDRGGVELQKVQNSELFGFSLMMVYRYSDRLSLGSTIECDYMGDTQYVFSSDVVSPASKDRLDSKMTLSTILRTDKNKLIVLNFGIGLSPRAPDVIVGFSLPIQLTGMLE